MFKVNNKNIQWRRSGAFLVNFEHISFTIFSSAFFVDFEQVNVSWVITFLKRLMH